jgi:hypothetical protein
MIMNYEYVQINYAERVDFSSQQSRQIQARWQRDSSWKRRRRRRRGCCRSRGCCRRRHRGWCSSCCRGLRGRTFLSRGRFRGGSFLGGSSFLGFCSGFVVANFGHYHLDFCAKIFRRLGTSGFLSFILLLLVCLLGRWLCKNVTKIKIN